MGLRDRDEIQFLLKLATEQRRRIKELETKLDALYRRFGRRVEKATPDEPDPRSGKASKASRKK